MNDAIAQKAQHPLNPAPLQSNPLPVRLVDGYKTFLGGRFRREQDRYKQLGTHGQKPKILLIGCCDSRVSPEVIFDADPGEIFVIRNIGNLIPPYAPDTELHGTSAALEYAVLNLKVEHIVVMGHASCGAVRAFAESLADPQQANQNASDFIGNWISLIAPAAAKIGSPTEPISEYAERLSHASIMGTLANLRSFPWVRTPEAEGKLQLHGAYFGVADGRLLALDEARAAFFPVAADIHASAFADARF